MKKETIVALSFSLVIFLSCGSKSVSTQNDVNSDPERTTPKGNTGEKCKGLPADLQKKQGSLQFTREKVDTRSLTKVSGNQLSQMKKMLRSQNLFYYGRLDLPTCDAIVYQEDTVDDTVRKFTLFTFNASGDIVARVSLAEDIPYPGTLIRVESVMVNSGIVRTSITYTAGDYDKEKGKTLDVVDSVVSTWKIQPNGLIEMTKKDSVRYIK